MSDGKTMVAEPAWSRDLSIPATAMAVGAHPDDVEFGCGGTLAKWAAAGCQVNHVVCTDGSKGTWSAGDDTAALVATRQEEQRAAALALGAAGNVVFLGWRDGELNAGLAERRQLCHWIRRLTPEVVLGHDPWKRYRLHPDHRHAGFLVVDSIVAARDPHFFPDQDVGPHRPSALLLWEADEPDHVEDITDHIETKLAAILAHRSQFLSTMQISDPESTEEHEAFRRRIVDRATEHGSSVGATYGERFKAILKI